MTRNEIKLVAESFVLKHKLQQLVPNKIIIWEIISKAHLIFKTTNDKISNLTITLLSIFTRSSDMIK